MASKREEYKNKKNFNNLDVVAEYELDKNSHTFKLSTVKEVKVDIEQVYHGIASADANVAVGFTRMHEIEAQMISLRREQDRIKQILPDNQKRRVELMGTLQDVIITHFSKSLTKEQKQKLEGCDVNTELEKTMNNNVTFNFKDQTITFSQLSREFKERLNG